MLTRAPINGRLVLLAVVKRAARYGRRLSPGFAADGRRELETRVLNVVSDLPVEKTAAERDDRGACVVDVGPPAPAVLIVVRAVGPEVEPIPAIKRLPSP
jgi:hypothetical protein